MSNDLIARLRDWSDGPGTDDLCREAAAEIEALWAEVTRLKSALSWLDRWIGHKTLMECADKISATIEAGKAVTP